MSPIYLTTYRALVRNRAGREAVAKYSLPPYIDGSCRREPDFEAQYPSISALCRGRNFAPRLQVGDVVVYMTTKSRFPGSFKLPHRRLTAVLKICERFTSHQEAAEWHFTQGLPIPSNCMVESNPPVPLDQTDFHKKSLRKWDSGYKLRTRKWGVFLVCRPLYMNLHNPEIIADEMLKEVFGRIPPTQTPPPISRREYEHLLQLTDIEVADVECSALESRRKRK